MLSEPTDVNEVVQPKRMVWKGSIFPCLEQLSLDLVLDRVDLAVQLGIARGDTSSNDRASDITGTSQSSFWGDKDIRNVLQILVNRC